VKRRLRLFFIVILLSIVGLSSCQQRPFSDKIDGSWTGSTVDKNHGVRFTVKQGKIDEVTFTLDFEPEKTGAMALMKCGYSVSFGPNSWVSGRDFSVDGTARGMRFGMAGQKSEQGTTTVDLRGTFTADDAVEGEFTLSLDQVPDCGRFNGKHVFQWNARRDGSPRNSINKSPPEAPPPSETPK
jgi:hypothetical protein